MLALTNALRPAALSRGIAAAAMATHALPAARAAARAAAAQAVRTHAVRSHATAWAAPALFLNSASVAGPSSTAVLACPPSSAWFSTSSASAPASLSANALVHLRQFHSSAAAGKQAVAVGPSISVVGDDDDAKADGKSLPVTELKSFLARVYTNTGYGVLSMFGAAGLATATGLAFTAHMPLVIGGFVGAMGSSLAMNGMQPTYTMVPGKGRVAVDSAGRKLAFLGLTSSFGIMAAPLIGFVALSSPMALPSAAFATVATMGGATLYALRAPGDSINAWRPALTGGLFGLIGVSLGGMGAQWLGYPGLAQALLSVNTYGGVVLFAGLTAYDTKLALDMHAEGTPDHLQAAAMLFMDFANLFQRFLVIFSNRDD